LCFHDPSWLDLYNWPILLSSETCSSITLATIIFTWRRSLLPVCGGRQSEPNFCSNLRLAGHATGIRSSGIPLDFPMRTGVVCRYETISMSGDGENISSSVGASLELT